MLDEVKVICIKKNVGIMCFSSIEKGRSYGYQIIKDVSDLIEISESTLYPILRRLEMGGKVKSYTTQYNNRLRKYFHLTEEGRQYLKKF